VTQLCITLHMETICNGGRNMKSFWLGFFMSLSLCLVAYLAWEYHRYVPVVIKPIPVPVPMSQLPYPQPEPAIETLEINK
jgi:hypothetical protein